MSGRWLADFVHAYEEQYDPKIVAVRIAPLVRPWVRHTVDRSKRWIFWTLHRRGLAYGLPLARPGLLTSAQGSGWQRGVLPFLAIWFDLVVEVEAICIGRAREREVSAWLLSCLCALVGADDQAAEMWGHANGAETSQRAVARACRIVAARLGHRRYSIGNPLLGLPLRNGFVYSESRLVGRIALRLATDQGVDAVALQRLRSFAGRERYLLVAALCALVSRDSKLSGRARRVAFGQLARLGMPRYEVRELKRLLAQPPTAEEIAALVSSPRAGSYLLQQLFLAAAVDGGLEGPARQFIEELARTLGIAGRRFARVEWRVRQFYRMNREWFDLFTETQYFGQLEAALQEQIKSAVVRNLDALVTEIRQTGELAGLLTRAAAGSTLSDAERGKIRQQLLDICRAVPSLAIFALPGGALLLPIVLKVLPWDLRPSAFRQQPPTL